MNVFVFLFVPTIVFLVIVAPIWIVMHYRSKNKLSRGLDANEREHLDHMLEALDKLMDRVETLESILSESHGEWRSKKTQEKSDVS